MIHQDTIHNLFHTVRSSNPNTEMATDFICKNIDEIRSEVKSHPLGFFHIKFSLRDSEDFVRIHFWPSDWSTHPSQVGTEVHTHCFDLHSFILMGTIKNILYDTSPGNDYEEHCVAYDTEGSKIISNNKRFNLNITSEENYHSGDVYSFKKDIFHKSVAICLPAITIVTESDRSDFAPRVAVPSHLRGEKKFPRHNVERENIKNFDNIIRELS